MVKRKASRTVSKSTRQKIAKAVSQYHLQKKREAEREARRLSDRSRKGWETRRDKAREREREDRRRAREQRAQAKEKAEREARRLEKWRKSYAEYLKFRVPKAEREKLKEPEKKELTCRTVFDAEALEDRVEQFWTNIRKLEGDSIGNILARIPATDGVVRASFRLISGEDFRAMQAGGEEDVEDYGDLHNLEWETELELEAFWSAYFEYARTLLPPKPEKQTTEYNAASLLLVSMQVCYVPGQISSDQE